MKSLRYYLQGRSLALKINVALFVIIFLIVSLLWMVESALFTEVLTRQAMVKGRELSELFTILSISPLRRLDYSTLRANAESLLRTEDILSVSLVDAKGFEILPFAKKNIPASVSPHIVRKEIVDEIGTILGSLELVVSLEQAKQSVDRALTLLQFSFGLILVIIWLTITVMLRFMLIIPIKRMAQSMEAVAGGAINQPVPVRSRDEIGLLASSFNTMTEKLATSLANQIRSEKMAALGGLVAGVSHEINTPLGVAITAVSMLIEESQNLQRSMADNSLSFEQLQAFVEEIGSCGAIIQTNLFQAANLVRSFKQVSSDQSSQLSRQLRICQYLEEIVASLRPEFKRTAIRIETECADNLQLEMKPGTVSQLITILVMNAKLHAFEPEQEGCIRITVRHDTSALYLTVEDNGRGMSEEIRTKIFDPFFTTRRANGGTGLGLYILHSIVCDQLDGTITVDSAPGQGCRFAISLPFSERDMRLIS